MAKNFYDMARCVETVEKIRQLFEPLNGWQRSSERMPRFKRTNAESPMQN
jgi:hypothetical protein